MIGRETGIRNQVAIAIIFGLFFCFFGLVVVRLWSLQVKEYQYFKKLAKGEHGIKDVLEPQRGWIMDRNGSPLATSVTVDALIASPKDIYLQKMAAKEAALPGKKKIRNRFIFTKKDLDQKLSVELAKVFNRPQAEMFKILTQDTTCAWIPLSLELTPEQSKQIDNICTTYRLQNELRKKAFCKRIYPKKDEACHILGPVGTGSMDSAFGGWGSHRPLGGLEMILQDQLGGTFSPATILKDCSGRVLAPMDEDVLMSLSGDRVYLTIDENIQRAVEEELQNTVEFYGARAGFVVAMNPKTGEILALANYPKYDLGNFKKIDSSEWRNVSVDRAIEHAFEPGSTFKVFTAAAALDENLVREDEEFNCFHGKIMFAKRVLRDSHPYDRLTFSQIIEVSSNIGIHQVAQRVGGDKLHNYIKSFGFGAQSGIELPGEATGLVNSKKSMTPLMLSRVSFGQSISVSAIQMASAISVIANGGKLMKPQIVKAIYDYKGKLKKEIKPVQVRQVLKEQTARRMAEIMEGVVLRGTGKGAAIPYCRVAGKTGTAQIALEGGLGYESGAYMASFVGFLPVEDPQLVIGVFIDKPTKNGHFGGTVSAPAFKRIAETALSQLKIHPKMPESFQMASGKAFPVEDSLPEFTGETKIVEKPLARTVKASFQNTPVIPEVSADTSNLCLMPELRGLSKRAAMMRIVGKELKVEWKGSGVVIEQYPRAGTRLIPQQPCQVVLGSRFKPLAVIKDTRSVTVVQND